MASFVNKLFISVQLIIFLDHVLLPAELAQKFKLLQIGTSGDLPLIIHVPNLQTENRQVHIEVQIQNAHARKNSRNSRNHSIAPQFKVLDYQIIERLKNFVHAYFEFFQHI